PEKIYRINYRAKHKDGHYLWREGSVINKLNDPYINAVVFYGRDISARINAEQSLKHQKNFYETILNKFPVSLAIYDTGHHFLFSNLSSKHKQDKNRWQIIGKKEEDYLRRAGKNE